MKNLESKLQQSCVRWFRLQYHTELLFAIPNGGKRNVVTASILKAEGVMSGVADLFMCSNGRAFKGHFIEMKYGKGKQTDNQIAFQKKVISKGYTYDVCCSFDEFVNVVKSYL